MWDLMCDEFQAMDLARQIIEGTPYPVKAIFGLGMNVKMFPATDKLLEAIKQLDFFVDADMFMSQTAKYADIVPVSYTHLVHCPGRTASHTAICGRTPPAAARLRCRPQGAWGLRRLYWKHF